MLRRNFLSLGAILAAALAGTRRAAAEPAPAGVPKLSADDCEEIRQLYARYPRALDTTNPELFLSCFTPDGEFIAGHGPVAGRNSVKGHDGLHAMGARGGTRHHTSNVLIMPTADAIKGSAYLYLLNGRAGGAYVLAGTYTYDDTLVKTADGWKFSRRVLWDDNDPMSLFAYKGPVQPAAPRQPVPAEAH